MKGVQKESNQQLVVGETVDGRTRCRESLCLIALRQLPVDGTILSVQAR